MTAKNWSELAQNMTVAQLQQRLKDLPDARFASPANAAEANAICDELCRRREVAA